MNYNHLIWQGYRKQLKISEAINTKFDGIFLKRTAQNY